MFFADARMRYLEWERNRLKKAAAIDQDRKLVKGLDEGCVFCGTGPWSWAYPMERVADEPEGEFLLPAWLPVCADCHGDIQNDREAELASKLHASNSGRSRERMRGFLPIFLAARGGPPLARKDAPELERRRRWHR